MQYNDVINVVKGFYEVQGIRDKNYRKHLRPASKLLNRADGDITLVFEKLRYAKTWFKDRGISNWSLYAVLKHWHEIRINPQEKEVIEKVDEGMTNIKGVLKKYERKS